MSVPFELHQLEAFVRVTELGSVTLAAAQLKIAQPALTRKIHTLENALGVQLFVRGHNRIILTAAGQRFKEDAVYILQLVELALASIHNTTNSDG
jgi:DNA-binding transcriptional LysR family regulator